AVVAQRTLCETRRGLRFGHSAPGLSNTERWTADSVGGRSAGWPFVGGFVFLCLPQAQRTVRGQAGIADLVKQGAIADAQRAGRLLTVPVVLLQHLQNDLALQFAHALAGKLLERN